jgi:hypothetical protein
VKGDGEMGRRAKGHERNGSGNRRIDTTDLVAWSLNFCLPFSSKITQDTIGFSRMEFQFLPNGMVKLLS